MFWKSVVVMNNSCRFWHVAEFISFIFSLAKPNTSLRVNYSALPSPTEILEMPSLPIRMYESAYLLRPIREYTP